LAVIVTTIFPILPILYA